MRLQFKLLVVVATTRPRRYRSAEASRSMCPARLHRRAEACAGSHHGGVYDARARPLAIEDYYRIPTVGSPAISPNGRWVAFTIATRIEDDNSTRTETFVVAADGSVRPTRVVHYGKDVTSPTA
jgi:hypothetical protein